MKRALNLKKVLKALKSVMMSAFLIAWSTGMLIGGVYGIAAVAVGIPAVICFNVFE